MTAYRKGWPYPVAFPERRPETTLAETIAASGGRQLHVAETEKYAHVTYFFNGGREEEYGGRGAAAWSNRRATSPTYDHKPEMSAAAAAATFVEHWREGAYRFGIINFANPDMVGHTGVIPAAVTAVETVDAQLGDVVEAVLAKGGACIVTADHGNCDHMLEPDGSPNTAHSLNPVPLIVTAEGLRAARRRHPRRRRPDRAGAARHRPAGADDRPHADRATRIDHALARSKSATRDEGRAGATQLRDRRPRRGRAGRRDPDRARADRDAGLHPAGDQGVGAGAGRRRGRRRSATS